MSWAAEQISAVDDAVFAAQRRGYHPDDVERLRARVLMHMRHDRPLPDLDRMALRRARRGVSRQQVDGLRTVLTVWSHQYRRDAAVRAGGSTRHDDLLRWSEQQIAAVTQQLFRPGGRRRVSYDEREVDAYLDRVVAVMRAGEPLPDPAQVRFGVARRRRGYRCQDVDAYLDELTTMKPEG